MASSERPTRSAGIYARMRADILGGRLEPGQRLKFPELSERYATSVGSAREALTQLVGDGLVQSQPRQGYRVVPLSHEDLADLTVARVELESRVLWLSVANGDMAWESQAVAAHHVLARTPLFSDEDADHPSDAWSAAHAAFHQALLAGCPNRRLLTAARALREEAELYLQWSVSFGTEPDRDLPAEHAGLLDAATARDADRACELLRDHIAHTAQLVIRGAPDEPNTAAGSATTGGRS
ncbi:GntR family transcriptional regulator [Amycolatopsis endophytica]|uniref:DNA-binding GntR family transcriptional regulator n=1 Tax=Amycolatopsis endophytica TaxID=860233 RepID=A0A853BD41_9PSEU|nr:GntR family transcriptional regulator [Amycolatopsis endophytica]NYI92346.1 DNA-binding GntR family transcriptional regulator [Amycolatopsis endophytica]